MSYRVIKWVKGNPYLYIQESYRFKGAVRTRILQYLGRATALDVYRAIHHDRTIIIDHFMDGIYRDERYTSQKPLPGAATTDPQSAYEIANPPVTAFTGAEDLTTTIIEELHGKQTVSRQFIEDLAGMPQTKQAERDMLLDILETFEGRRIPASLFADRFENELLPLTPHYPPPRWDHMQLPDDYQPWPCSYGEVIYNAPFATHVPHHFGDEQPTYLAHVRHQDLDDHRRILELQSDFFQTVRRADDFLAENFPGPTRQPHEAPGKYTPAQDDLDRLKSYRNTWTARLIREEIRRAARDGKQALYFPTGETAAFIEQFAHPYGINLFSYNEGDCIEVYGEEATVVDNDGTACLVIYNYNVLANLTLGDLRRECLEHIEQDIREDPERHFNPNQLLTLTDQDFADAAANHLGSDHRAPLEYFRELDPDHRYEPLGGNFYEDSLQIIKGDDGEFFYFEPEGQPYEPASLSDSERRVVDFYDTDIPKTLSKLGREVRTEFDDYGVAWHAISISSDDDRPISAF